MELFDVGANFLRLAKDKRKNININKLFFFVLLVCASPLLLPIVKHTQKTTQQIRRRKYNNINYTIGKKKETNFTYMLKPFFFADKKIFLLLMKQF